MKCVRVTAGVGYLLECWYYARRRLQVPIMLDVDGFQRSYNAVTHLVSLRLDEYGAHTAHHCFTNVNCLKFRSVRYDSTRLNLNAPIRGVGFASEEKRAILREWNSWERDD